MPMTIVVTNNAPGRIRGFLASCMCEIAPGVYTAPRMTVGVRERIWAVVAEWYVHAEGCSIVMTWPERKLPGGQEVRTVGLPRAEVHNLHGIYLTRRDLTEAELRTLTSHG